MKLIVVLLIVLGSASVYLGGLMWHVAFFSTRCRGTLVEIVSVAPPVIRCAE